MFKRLFGKGYTYSDFWNWFEQNSQDYFHFKEENYNSLFNKLDKQLSKIHRDLTFEFSADLIDGKREFIISADGILAAFPDVIKLVKEAPMHEHFKITAFRQRGDAASIEYDDITLEPDDIFFTFTRNSDTIDIFLYINGYTNDEDIDHEQWDEAALILLDTIAGEYDVATKIGDIDILPYEEINNLRPISDLPSLLDEKVSGVSL
ncbi:hypothetical protein [Bacillus sp. CECT 9360]|uniref:hypothetical protein n=1 Tax=Bacillus sp. CECT 9360 TaxID=2845821 RepID=UPI001E3B0906|nr:hypothetical protein [Bacillus sp. CECT 9360]CAH0346008.1 hypothetical protein BCI9360_02318 [Bacillus sp. CECT 9360]